MAPAPLLRVFTVREPGLPAWVEPRVTFEPLLRVRTTGVADATGATAPVPLERVRVAMGAATLSPREGDPEEPPPPVPATW